jgi:biopolymer transport protein ExbB
MSISPALGRDMRKVYQEAEKDHTASLNEAKDSEKRILESRKSIKKEISSIKAEVKSLNDDITRMQDKFNKLKRQEENLSAQKSKVEMDMREMAGTVRVVVRDLDSVLKESFFTVCFPGRIDLLDPIMEKDRFPGMDDFETVSDLFFQEMDLSGEVILQKGSFVGRSGVTADGDILTIGSKFGAAYRTDGETGFLSHSEGGRQYFALSVLPPSSIRRNLGKYMNGKSEDVYLDFSGGAALRQITYKTNLLDQIKKGGPIVWPILAIGLLALILVVERLLFLKKVHHNTDIVMGKVNELAFREDWDECGNLLEKYKGGPVHNVLIAGLASRNENREVLESVLQESILRELPRLERFLPIINILGVIAPLLGLLGTVTGMISTFHIITLYGTGDPRMMSGGISEALVTTELGLAVAIPIMLLYTFLRRRVERIVGDMEEKAVALTNIIHRQKV